MDGKDETNPDDREVPRLLRLRRADPRVPSHRALAVFRGRTQEILDAKLVLDEEIVPGQPTLAEGRIAHHLGWGHAKRACDELIRKAIAWTWKVQAVDEPGTRPVRPPARRRREGRHQGLLRKPARLACWPRQPASAS
jgi:hypothetical protein